MASRKPLTDDDGEVREWTDEMFAKAVPFSALPSELQALLSEPKHVAPDTETSSSEEPAA
jgi:hypothetical protein